MNRCHKCGSKPYLAIRDNPYAMRAVCTKDGCNTSTNIVRLGGSGKSALQDHVINEWNKKNPEMYTFYRLEGVWYDKGGNRINEELHEWRPMEYDEAHIGYLSCVFSMEQLTQYFGEQNLSVLLENGHDLVCFKASRWVMHPNGYPLVKPEDMYDKLLLSQ